MTPIDEVKSLLDLLTVDELTQVAKVIQDKLYHVSERPSLIPNKTEMEFWNSNKKIKAINLYRERTDIRDLTFAKKAFENYLKK